jgi:hypothetical protein
LWGEHEGRSFISIGWAVDLASPAHARPGDIKDLDFHTYVGNDPANKTDPSGKDPEDLLTDQINGLQEDQAKGLPPGTTADRRDEAGFTAAALLSSIIPMGGAGVEAFATRFGLSAAFRAAALGGRNAGLITNNLGRSVPQLEKGIRSLDAKIAEHEAKLADPASNVKNPWTDMRPSEQTSIIRDWKNEIGLYKEQRTILKDLTKLKQLKSCTGSRIPGNCY